jgi:hypothetical protein
MIENQHTTKVLNSAIYELLHPFLVVITTQKAPLDLTHIQEP